MRGPLAYKGFGQSLPEAEISTLEFGRSIQGLLNVIDHFIIKRGMLYFLSEICLNDGKYFHPHEWRGALVGVSKPENPEENWDKPHNPDYLSFNNCFKILHIDILCEV